jgi:hypothetical protein
MIQHSGARSQKENAVDGHPAFGVLWDMKTALALFNRRLATVVAVVFSSLVQVGCSSTATFARPYSKVREAVQTMGDRLDPAFAARRRSETLLLKIPSKIGIPVGLERAMVSGPIEVPDESYTIVVWDYFTSFPNAPHMEIRVVRLSDDTTRVTVVSQDGSLIFNRRVEHERETLSQIAELLSQP